MSQGQSSVAVIGGGIIGMSIAWRCAQRGHRVTVFEKGLIGAQASWAAAGMLAPGGEFDTPSPLTELALRSRRLYADYVQELEQASGLAIDYQECGALDLAYGEGEWAALRRRAERQAALGIPSKELPAEQVATFWPRVRAAGFVGALFYPGDALVDPRHVVAALKTACRGAGVRLREQHPVDEIERTPQRFQVEGEPFDALVIAAGAWSSSISISNTDPLPSAEPVKGHLVGFQQPAQTCNTILRHGHTYLLQRVNGLLIAGASVEHVGWDISVNANTAAGLARDAAFVMPHLAETTPSESWVGLRPGSDELRIGPWSVDRLFLAYGHYRNGILLAPVTAEIVTAEVS